MNKQNAISIAALNEMYRSKNNRLHLIDIRTAEEYHKLHIPFAANIPAESLMAQSESFQKNDTIVCVCNKGHERSQNAAALLQSSGFTHAFYLEGGTLGWLAESQPGTAL